MELGVVVAPAHVGDTIVQVAVVRGVRPALGRGGRPEVGDFARTVERRASAVSSRNGGKARDIVGIWVVPDSTCIRTATPPETVCQCLGDINVCVTAYILALASYIVGHRCPLSITRQVPPCRTYTPAGAVKRYRHIVIMICVHARLPKCCVERINRCVPVVEQPVVHRGIRGRVVVVPMGLLARVCCISAS